jgi:hypothetical protein
MRDLHNHLKFVRAISPVSVADNTAQVSQVIDRLGFESLEFVIATGTLGDAGAEFAVLVEEGDASDLSDAAAVADADLLGTEAQAGFIQSDDDEIRKIGYKGNKRYVRLTITPANNATAALLAAVAVLGNARRSPSQTGDGAAVTQVP